MASHDVPSVGAMIYIGVKPLIKFVIPVSFGFILGYKDLFPLAASKGASQLIINVLIPSLLFANVIKSIDTSNVSALGPITLVGALYQILGLGLAWLVRLTFPVPKNFRNGLLVAGLLGNWGDLPFAILQTVTAAAPFDPSTDPSLAQAYASVYVVIFIVTMFPLRAVALLARDYRYPCAGMHTNPPLARLAARYIGRSKQPGRPIHVGMRTSAEQSSDSDHEGKDIGALEDNVKGVMPSSTAKEGTAGVGIKPGFSTLRRRDTAASTNSSILIHEAALAGAGPFTLNGPYDRQRRPCDDDAIREEPDQPTRPGSLMAVASLDRVAQALSHTRGPLVGKARVESKWTHMQSAISHEIVTFAKALLNPPTLALCVALICALVKPLKALFVTIPGYDVHYAPDGKPVLDVLYEVTTFMGGAAVPTSLVILGSALSRISVPRPISKLPIRAIFAMAVCRLVLLPILGILIVQGLTFHTSIIPPTNTVLRFSMLILSCVPSATNQIVLTNLVAPDAESSNADIFGCFLLVQYVGLFVAMTITAAYSVSLVFG